MGCPRDLRVFIHGNKEIERVLHCSMDGSLSLNAGALRALSDKYHALACCADCMCGTFIPMCPENIKNYLEENNAD